MLPELVIGSFFTGTSVVILLYGFKLFFYRDIQSGRFVPGKYDPKTDEYLKKEDGKDQEITPVRTLLLILAGGVTAGVLVYMVVGIPWAASASSLLGLIVPRLWLVWHKKSKLKLASLQVEQAVEIMAAVLRSGGGLPQALERAAREMGEPLGPQLTRTVGEIRLGISTAEAFGRLADRIKLPEMTMLSMAVNLQQTGMAVNMAAVFNQIQDNIRGRQALAEEVSAITAENRMAGWIVAAVPFMTVGIMRQMAPNFVAPLFETAAGLLVFSSAWTLIIAGIIWIGHMSNADNLI